MAGLRDFMGDSEALSSPKLGAAVGGCPNAELTASARRALSGGWGMAVLGNLLYGLLLNAFLFFVIAAILFVMASSLAGGGNPRLAVLAVYLVAEVLVVLISGAVMVGFAAFHLGIAHGEGARLENFFVGFRRFGRSFWAYFFYVLFYSLWSLLLVIPGIVAFYRYAMTFHIIADDPTCGALEAIGRSKVMMKGNKWRFFCLNLRFVGWALLAGLTFGLGNLWLIPYAQTSLAKFYEDVK